MASFEMRNPGVWRVTISNGYGPDGKKKFIKRLIKVDPSKTILSQRREVEKEAAKIEADFQRRKLTEGKKIRLSEVAEEYLENHPMSESTKRWYRDLLNSRILPSLGKAFVQDLTLREVRAFYKSLTNEKAKPSYKEKEKAAEKANNDIKDPDIESTGIKKKQYGSRSKSGKLSGTYRQHYHRALSAIMSFALKSGYITVNPMQAVDAPRKDTPEAEFLEAADVAALVDALEDLDEPMWQAFFMLALYSSCRPGELIGLNWSDFNLDENELLIKAGSTYVKGKGTVRTDRPKTKSSVRKVILPEEALAPVEHWKSVQSEYRLKFNGKWPGEDAVFTGDLGKRIDKSSPTQKWRKIQERYGLKDVPLYSLRHTGASLMVAYGATIKEVSGRLGHSRTSTTLDIYTHLFTVAENHTSDIMSDAIKAAREGAKRGRFTQLGG